MSTLTDLLHRELLTARRTGDRAVAGTLRGALAALANAEAVPADDAAARVDTEHVAGVAAGPAEAEAERATLSAAEERELLHAEIAELREAAATYATAHPDRAADAMSGIAVLERVLVEAAG